MPHLNDRDQGHISIRLWQWLQSGNRPPRPSRVTGPDQTPVAQPRPTPHITPSFRARARRDIGTAMTLFPTGGAGAKTPRAFRSIKESRELAKLIERLGKAQQQAFNARTKREIALAELERRGKLGMLEESELGRRQPERVLQRLIQEDAEKFIIKAGVVIGLTAGAAAAIALTLTKDKRQQTLNRLNSDPQYRDLPDGSRAISNGRSYIKQWGHWWETGQ